MPKEEIKGKKSSFEQTSLINEIIKRENRYHSINSVFTLNLKRLSVITEKPNILNKEHTEFAERSRRIPNYIFGKIDNFFSIPHARYNKPMTSSQELGWFQNSTLNQGVKHHPKLSCTETKYANEYYALKGRSPFSSKVAIIKDLKK